ncbi:CLUMA_CG009269, isoform A [Clunio marinus]|uniref:CLUMA_CG009269, isoform A n=1 Tax=Clunio marinus TaxID=568069 RepID=A0A1J1IBK2_9DIPT|nr:CLUMA_CG009269, isoform A [Clunio marinus]
MLSYPVSLPIRYFDGFPYRLYQPEVPQFLILSSKEQDKEKPSKLSMEPMMIKRANGKLKLEKLTQIPKTDIKLVKAIQQPNSKFLVEKIAYAPDKRNVKFSAVEMKTFPKFAKSKTQQKSQKLQFLRQEIDDDEDKEVVTEKAEAMGMTSADLPIPDYSAYFSRSIFTQPGNGEEATLILEPKAKAISGNDGTSISSPLSRALLRRGTSVKVLFQPQSVAITGANGIAHAQADLLLDFIDDE